MLNRWTMIIIPLFLAIALVFVNRSDSNAAPILSSLLTPTAPSSPAATPAQYPPSGPASNKGDGGAAPPVAAAAANDETFDVRHTPSITVAKIREVLQSYNSPAVGSAEAMYRLGIEYGIDPAFCLAFFIHESTAGTQGVARVTKSVGNIRTTPGYEDYQGFRKYATWEDGIEDWYILIRDLYIGEWGLTTVDAIIPVYAPTSDGNNVDNYVSTVKRLVRGWRLQ
jgi:hypothetical protein